MRTVVSIILLSLAAPLAAQPPRAAPSDQRARQPVTIESYYRLRWGSFWDFMEIYNAHHAPVLDDLRARGFIKAVRLDTPVTHMAGPESWDLRVTITYRDGNAAAGGDAAYDEAAREAGRRLFPDRAAHLAAETRRFALIESHWDVIVAPYAD